MKIQQNEIYRLKTLKKEVADKMKKESDNAERRKEEETTQHTLGTKRLGRVRFEEEELELKLSEEITGNLRTLKVSLSLFIDLLFLVILFNCRFISRLKVTYCVTDIKVYKSEI